MAKDHKIHLDFCKKWEICNINDVITLVATFDGDDALKHALGAAEHLMKSGVLDSKYALAGKSQFKEFVQRSGAEYEIRIRDWNDQNALWLFTRTRYPRVHNKINEDTKNMFSDLAKQRPDSLPTDKAGFIEKVEKEDPKSKQLGLFE